MKVELFPFQKIALADLRMKTAEALGSYHRTHAPQVVSFTAPTGAGKTIIMSSLIENILFGDENYAEQQNAIFVWLSDSPQLNEQSKLKIDLKSDKIKLNQCITVNEDSFDQELFDDGYIYFLNTQKLSKTSNLTKNGDNRTYTIWETLVNTVKEKSDRLYFIIDEAHRGMQGTNASKATTIMQKFIKGSEEDKIPPMPVVIGMSATTERFNKLVEGTSSTIHKSIVTADDVRKSGLLKDRIVITYPEDKTTSKDMAVLQAAADDWKEKWDHWYQYCYEQHYAYVNPVFVIQVQNGTGNSISDTDLDDCLQKVEERTGFKFDQGQVVHTFGQTSSSITINGLEVPYEEPSRISDNKNIRVVFFKENLSTGWDCPRAETMMSFRRATDSTYIAQLLGRMVRTPMQMHIQVDDVLNDVHLYLPYFEEQTVKDVVKALQDTEGGEIPTEIQGEVLGNRKYETLTVKPTRSKSQGKKIDQQEINLNNDNKFTSQSSQEIQTNNNESKIINVEPSYKNETVISPTEPPCTNLTEFNDNKEETISNDNDEEEIFVEDILNREKIMKYINDSGLLSYNVRKVIISNYLSSLYKMARLLTQSGLYAEALQIVNIDVLQIIHEYIENLKAKGEYENLVEKVKQFKLSTQIFDAFGETVDNYSIHDLFSTTDADIDRQFRVAESKLGNDGIGNAYGREYVDWDNPNAYKIDVILFVNNDECMNKLHGYAKEKFHNLNDEYRPRIAKIDSDKIRKQYDNIVSDGDIVSKHNFRLPETIQVPHEDGGQKYNNHLFVENETGYAVLKLNTWEEGVIEEESKKEDFVCWIRNTPRASWALCIPYEISGEIKPCYPDFIIVRKDKDLDFVIDILEPHNPGFSDNLGKAKGFAEYARQNHGLGRIQLIRQGRDIAGKQHFKRLDMSKGLVREKVLKATNNDELDHIFDTEGFFNIK